jgi:hypothetical protein
MAKSDTTNRQEKVSINFDFQKGHTIVALDEADYKKQLSELKKTYGLKSFTEARMLVGVITPYIPTTNL